MCLELLSMNIENPSTAHSISYIKPPKNYKSKIPYKITNRIQLPVFNRPSSAVVSCLRTDIPKLLQERVKPKHMTPTELRPWSKTPSQYSSRPASSCAVQRKSEGKNICSLVVPTAQAVPDTNSSIITESQPIYPLTRYEEKTPPNEPNSAIQEYIAMNPQGEGSVFASDVPTFVHENFPKRKIKHKLGKKSLTYASKVEFPKRERQKSKPIPLKPSYFHLKRRYYPIKYKLDFIPRYCESPTTGLWRPRTAGRTDQRESYT